MNGVYITPEQFVAFAEKIQENADKDYVVPNHVSDKDYDDFIGIFFDPDSFDLNYAIDQTGADGLIDIGYHNSGSDLESLVYDWMVESVIASL